MHLHAISLAAQLTTQSQRLIVDFQHVCPLHNSPFKLWTHGSFIWRPSQYTARSGMNSVPLFCKFCHALVATASSFVSLQLSTYELHFCRSLCPAPKPICRRRSQTPRLLCSACSLQTVALFGRHWNGFEVCTNNLQGSSQSKQRAVECIQFTGKQGRTVTTHSKHTNAANQQVPKRRVFTTKQPSGTMIIYPLMRHIKLPITLHWRYSNDYRRVLANQLIGTRPAIRPRPPDTGPRPNGSLVPVLGLASAVCPMATPRDATGIPTHVWEAVA